MRGNVDSGHLRIIYINGLPLIVRSTSNVFPTQEMNFRHMVQGGPRPTVFEIEKKHISGTLNIPMYLNKDGVVADACREVIACGDNPLRVFTLQMDFGIMGAERTALLYQDKWDTSKHERLTFECSAATKVASTAEKNGNVDLEVSFIAIPEIDPSKITPYDLDVPYTGLMSRHCSFADCVITRLNDTVIMRDITNFNLQFENTIQELFLVPGTPEMSRDYAHYLYYGDKGTMITGSWDAIKRAQEWENERLTWNHGGYAWNDNMIIRIADIKGTIQDPLYDLQEQPLVPGVLKTKTNFKAIFREGMLYENNLPFNTIFPQLQT